MFFQGHEISVQEQTKDIKKIDFSDSLIHPPITADALLPENYDFDALQLAGIDHLTHRPTKMR